VGPTTTPAVDPGKPGGHPITTFDYRSAPRPWPAYESPLEVVGHVVLPEDVDDAPLVLFLHGRHQACYGKGDNGDWPCAGQSQPVPSQLGYDYLQRVLASQGYATVSIAANAINAQDWRSPDGGASAASNRYAVVTVSPGDTSGVIEVPFQSDNRDDRRGVTQTVIGVPLTGLAMGDNFGRVTITDDDPAPRLRLDARRDRIEYGGRMVFVAKLSAPVDYSVWAELDGVVLDRFRPLRVGDVRDGWVRRHLATVPADGAALGRWIRGDDFQLDRGEVRFVFEVPTKAHPPHPRAKALTIRVSSSTLRQSDRATVRVR
jgi:hypothetical protein